MYKIFVVALLAAANAAPADHQASSFVSFNDNHNSIHHIHSAPSPSLVKYTAPAAHVYAAPAAYATPAYAKVAIPSAPVYHAAPVAKIALPAASVYSAPVAKVALPAITKYAVAAPVANYATAPAYKEEEYGPAQYEFAYTIADPHTGDNHSQQEHRDGHHVVGQYSLHEADGTVRIVKYSDEGHGFNAVVERQGHPTEAPAAYKKIVAVAAPQYH